MGGDKKILQLAFTVGLAAGSLASAFQSASAAPAEIDSANKACIGHYQTWKKKRGWKAFAVSTSFVGRNKVYKKTYRKSSQACGYSWEFGDRKSAVNFAMSGCRYQLRVSKAGKGETCRATLVSK